MMKKHECFKNLVYIFMKNNKRKSEVADRFKAKGIKRATIYRWIKLVEEKKSIKRKKGSGRPVKVATRANILRIKKYFNHKSGRFQRKLARRINCTQSYII
jgi:transposase